MGTERLAKDHCRTTQLHDGLIPMLLVEAVTLACLFPSVVGSHGYELVRNRPAQWKRILVERSNPNIHKSHEVDFCGLESVTRNLTERNRKLQEQYGRN